MLDQISQKWRVARFTIMVLALITMFGTVHAQNPSPHQPGTNAEARTSDILRQLSSGAIARVEILQIPGRVLTRSRITPAMLEQQYHNKVEIRDITLTAYYKDVVYAFKSLVVRPEEEGADLRWGIVFYSRTGQRAGALYFDKTGRRGVVDDLPVAFQGDFFAWVDRTFSKCLQ